MSLAFVPERVWVAVPLAPQSPRPGGNYQSLRMAAGVLYLPDGLAEEIRAVLAETPDGPAHPLMAEPCEAAVLTLGRNIDALLGLAQSPWDRDAAEHARALVGEINEALQVVEEALA